MACKARYVGTPVQVCQKNGADAADANGIDGCNGGPAFICNSDQPWAVNDTLAFGFAAANIEGETESNWCCACYELTFSTGPANGKKMIVQVTNTGSDLGGGHFDLQIPGGGVGIFTQGCKAQWGAPDNGWGDQYGGVSDRGACDQLPQELREGCYWRLDWFKNANNPNVNFRRVQCPTELTQKTGCVRSDDSSQDTVSVNIGVGTGVNVGVGLKVD